MKKILLIFLSVPIFSNAQNSPRFENDTLYTLSGYKMYKGQTLQFGKATGNGGKFKYANIKNEVDARSLEDNYVTITELKDFRNSSKGNSHIEVLGNITFKDDSKGYIDLQLWFDQAIGNVAGDPGELIVPKKFITANTNSFQYIPRFEKDTLYTSCGYKIYKGLNLQFGKATRLGEFMYVNIKNKVPPLRLQNHSILVKELKDFGISALDNGYITIRGNLMINGNEREEIIVHMAFDHAIENLPGVPSELIVPDEFRGKLKIEPPQDIERLNRLYEYGTISLEELEFQKKKLLRQ